jgi:hypothetical protein
MDVLASFSDRYLTQLASWSVGPKIADPDLRY